MSGNKAYDIPTLCPSLRNQLLDGKITLDEAIHALCEAGVMNFSDPERALKFMGMLHPERGITVRDHEERILELMEREIFNAGYDAVQEFYENATPLMDLPADSIRAGMAQAFLMKPEEERDRLLQKYVFDRYSMIPRITQDKLRAACSVLTDNGIEPDEADTVLEALGYALGLDLITESKEAVTKTAYIDHYYVVEDLRAAPLAIKNYSDREAALTEYMSLPSDQLKAFGVENTNELPGCLDFVQCKDGVDTLTNDYMKVEERAGWQCEEIIELQNFLKERLDVPE